MEESVLKKLFIIFAFVVFCMSVMLTACQPTPEKKSVIGKSESDITEPLEKKVYDNKEGILNTPKNWNEQVSHPGISLDIVVDAEIEVPNVSEYPILEIKPEEFTQNQIEELIGYFTNGRIDTLYDADSPLTKLQLEEMIIEARSNLAKVSDPDLGLPSEIELEEYIENLEKQYANAPEVTNQEYVPIKLEKEPDSEYETFSALCNLGKKEPARILVMNKNDDDLSSMFCFDYGAIYSTNVDLYGKQAEGVKITQEEAKNIVEEYIDELGFSDMKVAKVETGENLNAQKDDNKFEQGYQITCVRWVKGIPVLPFERFGDLKYENDYIAKWYDQKMLFMVDDSGVTSFRWLDYGNVYEILDESSKLLPFNEIQEIFRKNIYLLNASFDESLSEHIRSQKENDEKQSEIKSFKVMVDSIKLGYITQPQKNKPGHFMLVPAWFFYGYNEQVMSDGSSYRNYLASGTSSCQMVLNAIDGTFVE